MGVQGKVAVRGLSEGADRLPANLRERLRHATSPHHIEVDLAFSGLDLCLSDSLARFLAAHRMALCAIQCRPGPHRSAAEALRAEMIEALDVDLCHLGVQLADSLQPVDADAMAVLYVLLGSQMGMRVLRKRWETTADPIAAGAGRIFTLTPRPLAWQIFCAELTGRAADDDIADRSAEDACRIFALYLRALKTGGEYLPLDPGTRSSRAKP